MNQTSMTIQRRPCQNTPKGTSEAAVGQNNTNDFPAQSGESVEPFRFFPYAPCL